MQVRSWCLLNMHLCRAGCTCRGLTNEIRVDEVPPDSVTTTVKNLMAPLTSLNQLQLNLKEMEDLLTTADLSLTLVLRGGTGGPGGVTSGCLGNLN